MIKASAFGEKTDKNLTKNGVDAMLTVPKILGGKEMSKFCTNCGALMEDDAVFCTGCGAKNEEQAAPVEMAEEQAPVVADEEAPAAKNIVEKAIDWVKANTLKTIIAAGAAIVVIILAIILLFILAYPLTTFMDNYLIMMFDEAKNALHAISG